MLVVAAVLRCRLIRKDFVESHVIAIDTITRWTTNDQIVRIAQVTNQSSYGNVDNVISKASTVGPTTRNESAVLERILDVALQHVAAEDAQARETGVVRITWATARQTRLRRGEIDLDQIRNENAGNVGAIRLRSNRRLEDKEIDQVREFRRLRILPEKFTINTRTRAAIQILISDRDESFVEERIALARDLHKRSIVFRLVLVIQHSNRSSTRSCINTSKLLVASELGDWDFERHQMKIEPTL